MTLQEKMKSSRASALATKYHTQGVNAAKKGLHAKDCPYDHPFKSSNWVRGYYAYKKEGENR